MTLYHTSKWQVNNNTDYSTGGRKLTSMGIEGLEEQLRIKWRERGWGWERAGRG